MKIFTYKMTPMRMPADEKDCEVAVSSRAMYGTVEVDFPIDNGRKNAAFVSMTPDEAEEMAHRLIVCAAAARQEQHG